MLFEAFRMEINTIKYYFMLPGAFRSSENGCESRKSVSIGWRKAAKS